MSAVAWSRSHLVCHWLQDLLPSERSVLGRAEPKEQHDRNKLPLIALVIVPPVPCYGCAGSSGASLSRSSSDEA